MVKFFATIALRIMSTNMSDFSIESGVLVKYIGNENQVIIPNSVTSIGSAAFADSKSLASVTIPNSVRSINFGAFANCIKLTEVTILDGVTSIEPYAFTRCTSLRNITIPNSITSISYHAFSNCNKLTKIIIPNSVAIIGCSAFAHCTELTEIIIPNSIIRIRDNAFLACRGLTEIIIPDSVTNIDSCAFDSCTRLAKIEIPEGCEIGHSAFQGCNALETIVISASDIERLSAPGIFPMPLDQYNVEIMQEEKSVARFLPKRYKELANSIYDYAKEKGIKLVAVKIFLPTHISRNSFHAIQNIPAKLIQDLNNAFYVFQICDPKIPEELQSHVLKEIA